MFYKKLGSILVFTVNNLFCWPSIILVFVGETFQSLILILLLSGTLFVVRRGKNSIDFQCCLILRNILNLLEAWLPV